MTDITERLRAAVPTYEGTPIAWPCEVRSELLLEAAAEVERLRKAHESACGGDELLRAAFARLLERLTRERDDARAEVERLRAEMLDLAEWCESEEPLSHKKLSQRLRAALEGKP